MKYCVTLESTIHEDLTIEANSVTEAKRKVKELFRSIDWRHYKITGAWKVNG